MTYASELEIDRNTRSNLFFIDWKGSRFDGYKTNREVLQAALDMTKDEPAHITIYEYGAYRHRIIDERLE